MEKVVKSAKMTQRPSKKYQLVFVNESQDTLIDNMVSHIKSPEFNPTSSAIDNIISTALTLHSNEQRQLSIPLTPPSPTLSDLLRLSDIEDHPAYSPTQDMQLMDTQRNSAEDDEDDEHDEYLPMDESHMLENVFLNEGELLSVFKSKTFQSYLKPSIHALFNKNDILNFIKPNTPMLQHLDSNGVLFLEHYVSYIASHQLDIGNKKFFLDYAISAASHHKSILFCLVAWGGMFLMGRHNEHAFKYLTNSRSLISQFRTNIKSNDELLTILSFYLLSLASEISTGDVTDWYQMLLHCKDLINQFGGFEKFASVNKDSNVAKWIVSSIFFHDVLSVRTLEYGTLFPMDDYKLIFQNNNFFGDEKYGLDPFQGLSYELYLIMGEFINKRLDFKKEEFKLKLLGSSPNFDDLYEGIETDFQIFDNKINDCKPPNQMINEILKTSDELFLESHLTLFELTQISLKIYIRISFIQRPFTDTELQALKSKGDKLFNILVGSKLKSMLCLPLLMLGIVSVKDSQRSRMKEMYENLLVNCDIKNITVCWEIIQQVWKTLDLQSNDELVFTDWTEIVNSLGWNCCFT